MKTGLKHIKKGLLIYLSAVFFNLFLGSYIWLPDFDFYLILIPLPESAAAVSGLLIIAAIKKKQKSGSFSAGLTALSRLLLPLYTFVFLLLNIFILLETFFQHVYRRSFQIAGNFQLTSAFFNMLFRTDLFSSIYILAAVVSAVFILLFLFYMLIFRTLLPAAGKAVSIPVILIAGFLTTAAFFFIPGLSAAERLVLQLRPAAVLENSGIESAREASAREAGAEAGAAAFYALPGIKDRNIHLFIAESYGMTVFTNPHHYGRLETFLKNQADRLINDGFHTVSSGYNSSTFGGTSWLADATILTGININSQAAYNQVVKEKQMPNLLHFLEEKGYKTILSAPGTKFMTPEYTGFYKFSEYVMHEDFEYEGPYFTYGDMPDQYQLFYTQTRIIPPALLSGKPLFVKYILCSSHVPWNYIPPYLESWSGFDSGRIYFDRTRNTWYDNSWVSGSELFEGYAHSIRYTLETVFGYITGYLGDNDLAVIIGDHQPKFPVSEKGAGFGVPVHIISRDKEMLNQFINLGYNDGIKPARTDNLPGLEQFLNHFLYAAEGSFLNLNSR